MDNLSGSEIESLVNFVERTCAGYSSDLGEIVFRAVGVENSLYVALKDKVIIAGYKCKVPIRVFIDEDDGYECRLIFDIDVPDAASVLDEPTEDEAFYDAYASFAEAVMVGMRNELNLRWRTDECQNEDFETWRKSVNNED